MSVWVSDDSTHKVINFQTSKIKDTASCQPPHDSPDLIVLRVTDSTAKDVYSVDSFIMPTIEKVSTSFFAGYPSKKKLQFPIEYRTPSCISLASGTYSFFRMAADSLGTRADVINHWLKLEEKSKIRSGEILGGYSGSPFFVQDSSNPKAWRIAGVFSGSSTNPNDPFLIFVKIEYALDAIEKF
jgi:hypothetical protein